MQIFLRGKTDGFILLRTLIINTALILVLAAALSMITSILRQSSSIQIQAENIILKRNLVSTQELDER